MNAVKNDFFSYLDRPEAPAPDEEGSDALWDEFIQLSKAQAEAPSSSARTDPQPRNTAESQGSATPRVPK